MRVNIRTQVLVGPLTGRARVLARCEDVPSLQTYSDHSIDKTLGFGNNGSRGRDPSQRRVRHVPGSRLAGGPF